MPQVTKLIILDASVILLIFTQHCTLQISFHVQSFRRLTFPQVKSLLKTPTTFGKTEASLFSAFHPSFRLSIHLSINSFIFIHFYFRERNQEVTVSCIEYGINQSYLLQENERLFQEWLWRKHLLEQMKKGLSKIGNVKRAYKRPGSGTLLASILNGHVGVTVIKTESSAYFSL